MPYVIHCPAGSPLATITYAGHLRGGEVADSFEDLLALLPERIQQLSVLCDTREATSLFALSGEIERTVIERTVSVLRRLEARAPTGREAYLGGRNHAVFVGIVRLLLKLVGQTGRQRAVFTDCDEAMAWLREADGS